MTEEQFEEFREENEFAFFIETEVGTVMMNEAPLSHVAAIDCQEP